MSQKRETSRYEKRTDELTHDLSDLVAQFSCTEVLYLPNGDGKLGNKPLVFNAARLAELRARDGTFVEIDDFATKICCNYLQRLIFSSQ